MPSRPATHSTSDWIEAAERLHQRYLVEIVEACGLCPWAERARVDGRVRTRVIVDTDVESLTASLDAIRDFEQEPRVEVGFLVYPRFDVDRRAFDRFTAAVRDASAKRHALGEIPFVLAAFHPQATPDTSHPERFIPFLRRTPDPTIQLLRASVLERVRGSTPQGTQFFDSSNLEAILEAAPVPLRERIARANLATATSMGVDALADRLDEIRRDRDATYAALRGARAVDEAVVGD